MQKNGYVIVKNLIVVKDMRLTPEVGLFKSSYFHREFYVMGGTISVGDAERLACVSAS